MQFKQLVKQFDKRANEIENDDTFTGAVEDNVFMNIASDLEFQVKGSSPYHAIDRVLNDLESGHSYEWQRKEWPQYCQEAKTLLLQAKEDK